jgi:hypothetical protein
MTFVARKQLFVRLAQCALFSNASAAHWIFEIANLKTIENCIFYKQKLEINYFYFFLLFFSL